MLKKQDDFRWKLSESRMTFVESSMKTGWLPMKAPRKQDDFRWELYKSRIRMTFVESSPKAGWLSLKALWKQDDFRWKLHESKMTFVESSTKAGSGWLSLKAPRKVYKSRMTFVESWTVKKTNRNKIRTSEGTVETWIQSVSEWVDFTSLLEPRSCNAAYFLSLLESKGEDDFMPPTLFGPDDH